MEKVQEELKRESELRDPHITGQFTRETARSTHWSELGVGQIQQPEGRYKADEFARHVLRRSDAALDHATSIISTVFRMARRMGRLNLSSLNHCARTLVDSMLDHPNALMWTLRTKRSSGHVYRRSVGCAVYSIALGQKLRYEKDMLAELALGGLLLDIGKIADLWRYSPSREPSVPLNGSWPNVTWTADSSSCNRMASPLSECPRWCLGTMSDSMAAATPNECAEPKFQYLPASRRLWIRLML